MYEHKAIINDYLSGLGSTVLAKKYNTTSRTICDILEKNNIPRRKLQKFSRNSNYFSIINPSNSYWAGLLAADGNITLDKKSFSITLRSKDSDLLNTFQKELEYTGNKQIKEKTNLRQSSTILRIFDPIICKDLINNFNIVPAKSLVLQPPKLDKIEYILPFIKGYIDGDGTTGYYNFGLKTKRFLVQIIGTKPMLSWMLSVLNKETNNHVGNISKHGNIFTLRFGGEKGVLVYNLLQNSSEFGLERKWQYINPDYKL